jgi:hypothetical protein
VWSAVLEFMHEKLQPLFIVPTREESTELLGRAFSAFS